MDIFWDLVLNLPLNICLLKFIYLDLIFRVFFFIHFDFKMVNQILGCKSEPQLVKEQGHIFTQCDPLLYWMLAHVFEDCLQIIQIWCSCAVFFMWHTHQLRLGPSSHSSISPSPYRNWNLISFMVAYFKILHNHFPTKLILSIADYDGPSSLSLIGCCIELSLSTIICII